jgi:predicted TIM-barrel fold metal-dependent hydrolase
MKWRRISGKCLAGISEDEQSKILWQNAAKFYKLEEMGGME